jgi:hypothetical protein
MRLRVSLALVVVAAGIVASPAAATLPDLHVLEGETYPVSAAAENAKVATTLSTAATKLEGVGFTTKISCKELTALCAYEAFFKGIKEGKLPCKSGTEVGETVKVAGEVHLVEIKLSPLALAALFLVPTVEVLCGTAEAPDKVKIKIEGSLLGSVNVAAGTDVTMFTGTLKGEKGKQELTKYFNDEEKEVAASLKANFGLGFEAAAENVAETVTFSASKMVDFLF